MEELITPSLEEYVEGRVKIKSENNYDRVEVKSEVEDEEREEPKVEQRDSEYMRRFVSFDYIICGCGKNFKTEELLRKHLANNEHEKKCTKKVVKEYQCMLCTRVFSSKQGCGMHVSKVHSIKGPKEKYKAEKNNVCEVCGKSYNSAAALRYHMRVHTGEKPYSCHLCPKAFTMPLFLQLHIRTHTGERPYSCDQCPKAFANKAAIMRHLRVHTGEKPYECPECGKAFSQSNSMKLHLRTVHWKEPAPYKSKSRKNKLKAAPAAIKKETILVKIDQPKPKPSKMPVVIKIKKTDIIGKLTFASINNEHVQLTPEVSYEGGEKAAEEFMLTEAENQEPCEVTIDNDQYQYFVEDDVQYQVEIKPECYEES